MSLRNHLDAEGRFQGEPKTPFGRYCAVLHKCDFFMGGILVAFPPLYPGACPPSDVIFKELKVIVMTFTFTFLFPLLLVRQ
jgi:hypothetical protein